MILLNEKPLSQNKINEWILVLEALNIPYSLETANHQWQIWVEEEEYENASLQISLYESENQAVRLKNLSEATVSVSYYAILVPFFLYLFFILANLSEDQFKWLQKGSANAEEILKGAWWRAITALTLHGDIAHLFSNLLFGSITATLLNRQIGSGLGWCLILLSGFLGDWVNSLMFQKHHVSIGASTAVFGIIGILSSLQFHKSYRLKRWKAWVPFASGLSMLAFFGTEGKNTDITAHFFGFFSGILIGMIAGFSLKGNFIQARVQFFLNFIALFTVILAWLLALNG